MKREIHGNIEGVRRTALDQMKLLYDLEIDTDVFLPPELSRILAAYTAAMNREIAVYITRDGEIVDIMIGTHQDVELTDYRLRRNSKRLSCVRCIHTHPSATGYLSDVDISALRSFRYDAMTAIAVRDGQPQEVQTAFLGEKIHGENQVLLLDPLRYDRIPQARWMELIEDADQAVLRGEDANAHSETERAVLMGIESEESLKELRRLAETASRASCRSGKSRMVRCSLVGAVRRSLRGNVRRLRRTSAFLTRNCPGFRCAIWRSCCG